MTCCRILVVDDYVPAATAIARLLQVAGHDVRTVFAAKDVLSAALDFQPDVIFLDISLSARDDGAIVASRLRNEPRLAQTVLVALSGRIDAEAVERIARAGFDYHLLKPAGVAEIERIIASVPPRVAEGPRDNRISL